MFASRANAVKSGYKAAQAERLQDYTIVSDEELKKRASRRAAEDARVASLEQYAATRTKPEDCPFPLNLYVRLGDKINAMVNTERFGNLILGVIGAACVMVGVGTYDEIAGSPAVKVVEDIITGIFAFEVLLKIMAETTKPWRFFTGPSRAWNNFDFAIVVACSPIVKTESAAVLRLMRLLRMAKLVRKIPKLRVLIEGLAGGLSTVAYISLLIILLQYMFAICGIIFMRDNDPWHWATLGSAMVTLFRCATLEDWTDVMYINMYGCADYGPYSYGLYTTNETECNTTAGSWDRSLHGQGNCQVEFPTGPSNLCDTTVGGKEAFATIYFFVYITFSALVLLSMFVGAITLSMSESIKEINAEQAEKKKQARAARKSSNAAATTGLLAKGGDEGLTVQKQNERARLIAMLKQAWDGNKHAFDKIEEDTAFYRWYSNLATVCSKIVYSGPVQSFVMAVIVVTGVLVGVETDDSLNPKTMVPACPAECLNNAGVGVDRCRLCDSSDPDAMVQALALNYPNYAKFATVWDYILKCIFTMEMLLKIIAFRFEPLQYFADPWNRFDFIIVVGSYAPSAGDYLIMLRMLRLLLILKMIKSVPELKVVIVALIQGASSIGYIGLGMLIVFYFFAICAAILFKENDPWHFANLHTSMLTLFRCATLEDWTDVMYINMFGCDLYGYSTSVTNRGDSTGCVTPKGMGYVSAIFFIFFTVIGSLVMLNLFIGVITTAMEESTNEMKEEQSTKQNVAKTAVELDIKPRMLLKYEAVFKTIDVDDSGKISMGELRDALEVSGIDVSIEVLYTTLALMDTDDDGEVDFAEFLRFMHMMRTQNQSGESVRNISERMQNESLSELARMVRTRGHRVRNHPYFAFVGHQFSSLVQEYAACPPGKQPMSRERLDARAVLQFAGQLEAFLREFPDRPFYATGMEYLAALKRDLAPAFDMAHPDRNGPNDLSVPRPPRQHYSHSNSARQMEPEHFKVFAGVDKLPKVLV